jgi:hypothetical protein
VASNALPYANPANDEQYADDLDDLLGAPLPVNPATLAVTSAWVQSESPTFPGWNGLGTELHTPGATPDPSNPNVFDYPTPSAGLEAAVDMLAGDPSIGQSSLDPAFVADVRKGNVTATQLVSDIRAGDWDGSPDTYDADAIASKLSGSQFSVAGTTTTGGAGTSTTPVATTASLPGGSLDPLNWPGEVIGSAASSIAGDVGTWILKGILTLVGGALFFYGATLLTGKGDSNGSPSASPAIPAAAGDAAELAPF